LFHRAKTALRAISDLRLGESFFIRPKTARRAISDWRLAESFFARAFPPLRPPNLPKATAAGFFMVTAFVLERLGMMQLWHINSEIARGISKT
jgi:hypothetical protein